MSQAAAKGALTLGQRWSGWVSSPTGPRTTHFWGPVANWGFVLAVSGPVLMQLLACIWLRSRGRRAPRGSAWAAPGAWQVLLCVVGVVASSCSLGGIRCRQAAWPVQCFGPRLKPNPSPTMPPILTSKPSCPQGLADMQKSPDVISPNMTGGELY